VPAVGGIEPRKGSLDLLDAYARLCRDSVFGEHGCQMPLADDEHPVGALPRRHRRNDSIKQGEHGWEIVLRSPSSMAGQPWWRAPAIDTRRVRMPKGVPPLPDPRWWDWDREAGPDTSSGSAKTPTTNRMRPLALRSWHAYAVAAVRAR
jgi:hypothetical protein